MKSRVDRVEVRVTHLDEWVESESGPRESESRTWIERVGSESGLKESESLTWMTW